jgi:hypothetical protein
VPANADELLAQFRNPPRECSLMPFWFWNDTLNDEALRRQIADFEAHGVYGFVIHPRIGLPEDTGWLSPRMLHAMHVAVDEAVRRKLYVILYDEGMYPSGSSAGQVVARNPEHAARGLAKLDLQPGETPRLPPGWHLITVLDRPGGQRLAVVERPSGGVIRGLHYRGEGTAKIKEDAPLAADILNPEAVASFIDLVYERYAREFGAQFGTTILGVFTDEPSPMGRGPARGMVPGSRQTLQQVNRILGYDFTPYLADLWSADTPQSAARRRAYQRAIHTCFEHSYYRQLSQWCTRHGIALMGHPGGSADLGMERYFQIPGQDLVWRMVEPGPKALEGLDSTAAKCASSAMLHLAQRRNSNELYGAYGHNLTFAEMEWLAHWCLVRGHNLLFPHAFYYSVRGPRFDERPPDVGPNAAWWNRYRPYADRCRRLCWINTDSRHVCQLAILGDADWLPWDAAKVCYQQQRDFNYVELRHLWEDARVEADGLHLAAMRYGALIIDGLRELPAKALPVLEKLAAAGRLVAWGPTPAADTLRGVLRPKTSAELIAAIDRLVPVDVTLQPPQADLRVRHVVKGGSHFYLLFNEGGTPVSTQVKPSVAGHAEWLDPTTGSSGPAFSAGVVRFQPYELKVLYAGER